jgi:ParB/RepB/Spo0J family partition protein
MASRTAVPAAKAASKSTKSVVDALTDAVPAGIVDVALELIDPHPHNPRKDLGDLSELTASIAAQGVLQNVTVVPHPEFQFRYLALLGHRRIAAAQAAGLTTVPAGVRAGLSLAEQIELMLVENLQRTDLTITEEGAGYQGLLDLGLSKASIVQRTGRAKNTVESRIRVAGLPDPVRTVVDSHQLTIDDALTLADWQAEYPELVQEFVEYLAGPVPSIDSRMSQLKGRAKYQADWNDAVARLAARGVELVGGERVTRGVEELSRLGIDREEHDACPGARLWLPNMTWGANAEQWGHWQCADPEQYHPDEVAAVLAGQPTASPRPVAEDPEQVAIRWAREALRNERIAAGEARKQWIVRVLADTTEQTEAVRAALVLIAMQMVHRDWATLGCTYLEEPLPDSELELPTRPAELLALPFLLQLDPVADVTNHVDEDDFHIYELQSRLLNAVTEHGPGLDGGLHYAAPVEGPMATELEHQLDAYRAYIADTTEAAEA